MNTYKVRTKKYRASINYENQNFIFMRREDSYREKRIIFDTFGPLNIFMSAELETNLQLKIKYNKILYPLSGKCTIYIPPYSIIEWHINPGKIKWTAIILMENPNDKICGFPEIYPLSFNKAPESLSAFLKVIKEINPLITFRLAGSKSKWSSLLKKYIEDHYLSNTFIQDFSKKYNLSRTSLSRSFKNTYGISPAKYRSRIRVFHASKKILDGGNVTDAMNESGFEDSSQFNFHFKSVFGENASKFKLKSRQSKLKK